jgi:protein-S-isoprenylcysteine O-methyltransferase Ste14
MIDSRPDLSRRQRMVERLGGAPGRHAVASVALALMWFPFRLWIDHGDPIAHIAVLSGLYGTFWALMIPAFEWMQRRNAPAPAPAPPSRQWVRRGAFIGLAVGVPFQLALITVGVATGVQLGTVVLCAIALVSLVVVALVRLRRA